MLAETSPAGPLAAAIAAVVAAYIGGRFARAGQHETAQGNETASLRTGFMAMSAEIRALQKDHEDCLEKHRECETRCARLEGHSSRQDEMIERLAVKVERLQAVIDRHDQGC